MPLNFSRPKRTNQNTYNANTHTPVKFKKETKKSPPNPSIRQEKGITLARTILTWLAAILLGVCFLAFVLFALMHGYRFATTSTFFAIDRIDIRGTHHFNREQLLALAQIEPGMNSLQISITDIEKRLRENPWIAEVSVKRRLPNRFEIRIKEWQPHFWLKKDDQLFYANIHGESIAPLSAENFISLPTLEISTGGNELMALLPAVIAEIKSASLPLDMQAVSWVKLSAAKGFEFFLEKQQLTICIAPNNWEANLNRLAITIQDLATRSELKETKSIWASDGNVWVVKDDK